MQACHGLTCSICKAVSAAPAMLQFFIQSAARAAQNMMNGLVEKSRGHMSAIASIESLVPDSPQRTVSAHEGGAYALAFDR